MRRMRIVWNSQERQPDGRACQPDFEHLYGADHPFRDFFTFFCFGACGSLPAAFRAMVFSCGVRPAMPSRGGSGMRLRAMILGRGSFAGAAPSVAWAAQAEWVKGSPGLASMSTAKAPT